MRPSLVLCSREQRDVLQRCLALPESDGSSLVLLCVSWRSLPRRLGLTIWLRRAADDHRIVDLPLAEQAPFEEESLGSSCSLLGQRVLLASPSLVQRQVQLWLIEIAVRGLVQVAFTLLVRAVEWTFQGAAKARLGPRRVLAKGVRRDGVLHIVLLA